LKDGRWHDVGSEEHADESISLCRTNHNPYQQARSGRSQ
jgi:hypothetical protein